MVTTVNEQKQRGSTSLTLGSPISTSALLLSGWGLSQKPQGQERAWPQSGHLARWTQTVAGNMFEDDLSGRVVPFNLLWLEREDFVLKRKLEV